MCHDFCIVIIFLAQQSGYWTKTNMRLYFENFAKSRSMDPLLAETWYNVSINDVAHLKVNT